MIYPTPSDLSEGREGEPIPASSKTVLFSHNYRLNQGDKTMRIVLRVPVYVEPLPMHLVEMPAGSGRVVSRWSVTQDIGAIPSHQKVNLKFMVKRPVASNLWEEADRMGSSDRQGYGDGILQYDEFTSPEGRKAYRDSIADAQPVTGVRFALIPDASNSWLTSQSVTIMSPDFTGSMRAEITPGTYRLKMLVQIRADGTTGLKIAEGDSEMALASRYDQLGRDLQAAVQQKYAGYNFTRDTMLTPETIDVGIIEAPAGFFYRETSDSDSTPVGAVGVKLTKTGTLADLGSSRLKEFKLEQKIPALLNGKSPEAGSIYDMMGIDFPSIDGGWPSKDSSTDARFFDTATIMLSPDSSVDLSMLEAFEQRYESERSSGGNVSARLVMPAVGQSVQYNGFIIEHLLFDTSVGPELKNKETAMSGAAHEYDMGKIDTAFFDVGVLRALVFYPESGMMRRKMVVPGDRNVNQNLLVTARHTGSQFNAQQAAMDRVYYFDVKSSPEGAILSGRWAPLETIGEYNTPLESENIAFQKILDSIRKGGLPLRGPKWNQFWSTTGDGWLFGGNAPTEPVGGPTLNADDIVGSGASELINAASGVSEASNENAGGAVVIPGAGSGLPSGLPSLTSGTSGAAKLETEDGFFDALVAPNPNYGEMDDDMGFVEG